MARVVVPALSRENVASACLRAEHVEHEVHLLDGPLDYAALIAGLWRDGEAFVVVEDDIAPWPGAVQKLLDCPAHWCGHYYPLEGRWDLDASDPESPNAMWGTTGLWKVDETVLRTAPDLYERFEGHDWQTLDMGIYTSLRHVFCLEGGSFWRGFHVHEPAVAHAMHFRPKEALDGRDQEQQQVRA
jgi:hypothetical protein